MREDGIYLDILLRDACLIGVVESGQVAQFGNGWVSLAQFFPILQIILSTLLDQFL